MSTIRTIGKAVAALGAGGLAVLAAVKVRDDHHVDEIWRALEQSGTAGELFTEQMVTGLPDPARRYFLHAIRPGTLLAPRIHFGYHGSMKPGKQMPWMSLTVEQITAKETGFVWKARARSGPLVLTAADHYLNGDGRMRIALFGLLPVVNATGPDLSRSALARLLIEGLLLPSALLPGPNVQIEGIDESRFKVVVKLHGESTPLTLTVDPDGRLKEIAMERWGNLTDDGSYRYIPYGATIAGEATFGGYTIPSWISVGWWYGTDRYEEVIRLELDWAQMW